MLTRPTHPLGCPRRVCAGRPCKGVSLLGRRRQLHEPRVRRRDDGGGASRGDRFLQSSLVADHQGTASFPLTTGPHPRGMAIARPRQAERDERAQDGSSLSPFSLSLHRPEPRSRIPFTPQSSPAGCTEISDSDFCVLEDELDSEGVYVDLLENPERFTGYAGPSSARVWKAIYEENCFTPVPFVDASRPAFEGGTGFAPVSSGFGGLVGGGGGGAGAGGFGLAAGGWGESEKRLLGSLAGPRDPDEEVCLEKRVFYRVISGAPSLSSSSSRVAVIDDPCATQDCTPPSRCTSATTTSTSARANGCVHIAHPTLLAATPQTDPATPLRAGSQPRLLHHAHRPAPRTPREHVLHLRPPPPRAVALGPAARAHARRDGGRARDARPAREARAGCGWVPEHV